MGKRRETQRRKRQAKAQARKKKRQEEEGRGWWRWLGVGALGLAALALWKNPRDPESPYPRDPGDTLEDLDVEDPFILPNDAEEAWISGPAGSLRFLEVNPGAPLPVIFIHGLGGGMEHWAVQLQLVGEGLHAVAFDLPGHGGSDPVDGAPLALHAAAVGAVLDGLGLRRAVLVAHSLGALAALRYAATHSRRVAGVFLVDPTGDQTRIAEAEHSEFLNSLKADPRGEMKWQYRQLLSESRPPVARKVLETLAAVSDQALLTALESSHGISPSEDLTEYGGAVRLVLSDFNDLPYALHRLHPEIPTTRLPGASHWLMMDRPVEVWDLLLDFLGELRERGMV